MSDTLAASVAAHAGQQPASTAFIDILTGRRLSWRDYRVQAQAIAVAIADSVPAGGVASERHRVAVAMPDGVDAHAAFLGCELAGVIAVGIGARTGPRETSHLLSKSRATAIFAAESLVEAMELRSMGVRVITSGGAASGSLVGVFAAARPIDPDELWFLNSTSGTTGLPKLVRHHQRRWFAFHDEAHVAGRFRPDDVFCSLLPAPFGFGLWTAHFTPTILGRPCVVADRFDPDDTLAAIERDRVTVLAAVPTQLALLLNSPRFASTDFSSLRVVFTGGEMLPYPRAVAFEDRTGAMLLQFYGATETGALSRTTLDDDRETRLRTAGHLIANMNVRLIDDDDRDVTASGGPAVPVCKGPLLSLGYDGDNDVDSLVNAGLYTADGSVRMPDLVTIDPPGDPNGVLTVVGRTSDLIIRGGKNISAVQVEEEVMSHPDIALAAAVAMPDPVFGERVCVFAVAASTMTLELLREHLRSRGVGRELWPEHLVVVANDLPRSSGGKVAKSALRADAARLAAAHAHGTADVVNTAAAIDTTFDAQPDAT